MKRCLSCDEKYSETTQGCPKCGGRGWCLDSGSTPTRRPPRSSSAYEQDLPTTVVVLSAVFYLLAGLFVVAALVLNGLTVDKAMTAGLLVMALFLAAVGFGLSRLSIVAWFAALVLLALNFLGAVGTWRLNPGASLFQVCFSLVMIGFLLGPGVRRAFFFVPPLPPMTARTP